MVRHLKAWSVLRPKTSQSLLRPSQLLREDLLVLRDVVMSTFLLVFSSVKLMRSIGLCPFEGGTVTDEGDWSGLVRVSWPGVR